MSLWEQYTTYLNNNFTTKYISLNRHYFLFQKYSQKSWKGVIIFLNINQAKEMEGIAKSIWSSASATHGIMRYLYVMYYLMHLNHWPFSNGMITYYLLLFTKILTKSNCVPRKEEITSITFLRSQFLGYVDMMIW